MTYDCAIIGGGIVGLATAMTLQRERPGARVMVIEKEPGVAQHQTGRNSGVIHSGIYYNPGSLKARMARTGNRTMREFCTQHEIPFEVCGKLIVATNPKELPLLENLYERGRRNELEVAKISPARAREIEPHVNCIAALHVPGTGIVSYRAVARKMAELVQGSGGEVLLGTEVTAVRDAAEPVVETRRGAIRARFVVNCGGLHSDRIARRSGCEPGARIVPFRGEYYSVAPEQRHLVNGLIYPVPNPDFPFLGVHFTRMIDGTVHAGPNAVLALHREAYTKTSFPPGGLRDLCETLFFPGFRKLAAKHWHEGWAEMVRSFSKRAFTRSLQQLVPEITERDLVPCPAGVRAQALRHDGSLVDDFLLVRRSNTLHVCNAPSPAATASLEIAKEIVKQIPAFERTVVAAA